VQHPGGLCGVNASVLVGYFCLAYGLVWCNIVADHVVSWPLFRSDILPSQYSSLVWCNIVADHVVAWPVYTSQVFFFAWLVIWFGATSWWTSFQNIFFAFQYSTFEI
jgi:hypothetical protein